MKNFLSFKIQQLDWGPGLRVYGLVMTFRGQSRVLCGCGWDVKETEFYQDVELDQEEWH